MQRKAGGGVFSYFKTEAGRKLVFFAAGTTTIGLCVANFVPHTFGLKYYRQFVQCYQNGIEREVPPAVEQRVHKAMEQLNVDPREAKFIKTFTVFGFDLFQAGTTKFRFGGALGIPVNYAYNSIGEIKRADIRFRDQQIKWGSDNGKLLEEAIVLTEDEQVFGLSKAILQLQTHRVLMNSVFPSVSFLMVYTLGRYLNMHLNLFAKHGSVRCVMYGILGLFGIGSWSFMKDFNQVTTDADIDKKLAALGPQFVAAGISYYDKQLKKNIALRHLIGDDTYTALGNENFLLRQKTMPLTARKSFFEQKWKELQNAQVQ
ncbi:LOW QUALITY PROTEIN: transmembrane protein 177 [Drosophila sulfurigaster albostrigata]|uniref:LOW QUALITY PROTEIN: transmembrane protein 177 n=1 Tax=Drosophila sulfurigaster albostrigata TaxID=89887 RepID=UPI002D218A51|nr:LOW QUALITY PROTEIN: transmembrane protein 177 [Drosophila sulfurigaster albostrigata]